ncbi:Phytanoyl-CoA dioxygenase [Thalassoporum mexicanum PCC 7367]|uniref:phytanoyl-CoA dioxygenase family protein n=1 Tax=Thalassoporum mexicanum TaxID=3457544 RepID=UPI00029F80D9|nr:phytanoyl-CoA dioxygenase family protein [Pseudanabaena sp. PCC 7367]AFY69917.1 Phytanoyl-CoA dioxygenase [Pseudanabaena sp. PCC 7367]
MLGNATEENTFPIEAPDGKQIQIPIRVDDATDPYLELQQLQQAQDPAAIRDYYDQHGYVVLRGIMPDEVCDRAIAAYKQQAKPYQGHLYRQTSSGDAEKNRFSDNGYLLNSILNVQDLGDPALAEFKQASLDVITHQHMYDAAQMILGELGIIVQSMYFEGNPATWAHQDSYYLDASEIGRLTAAWIALEDIQPGAGRFYVYPGSHKIDMAKNGGDFDIAFSHERYKQLVINVIDKYKLECHAPALRKGDVLFWNSKTIHGSLQTAQPQFSRSSMTAHLIPSSTGFLQFQTRDRQLKLKQIGAFQVNCPKDQEKWLNRQVFNLETRFPQAFKAVKKVVIKLVTR